jgi:hypothetical protein
MVCSRRNTPAETTLLLEIASTPNTIAQDNNA